MAGASLHSVLRASCFLGPAGWEGLQQAFWDRRKGPVKHPKSLSGVLQTWQNLSGNSQWPKRRWSCSQTCALAMLSPTWLMTWSEASLRAVSTVPCSPSPRPHPSPRYLLQAWLHTPEQPDSPDTRCLQPCSGARTSPLSLVLPHVRR